MQHHCRCGELIPRDENFCADCIARINAQFAADRERVSHAGSFGFVPENEHERRAHRRALRGKNYGSGMA